MVKNNFTNWNNQCVCENKYFDLKNFKFKKIGYLSHPRLEKSQKGTVVN